MDLLAFLVILVVLAAAVAIVSAPLRRPGEAPADPEADVAALEAAKEAKYREIRDAEMDHETGKLSNEDWERTDAQLRAEALEILGQLDDLGPGS